MSVLFSSPGCQQKRAVFKNTFFLSALLLLWVCFTSCSANSGLASRMGSSSTTPASSSVTPISRETGEASRTPQASTSSARTGATTEAEQWSNDTRTTTPVNTFIPDSNTEQIAVSPVFSAYYQRYAADLGNPLTSAFPISQGWLQFFTGGALFLPAQLHTPPLDSSEDILSTLIKNGTKDAATGIVSLPLLQVLLTLGSKLPIYDRGSSFTYIDLRKATNPERMQPAPTPSKSGVSAQNNTHPSVIESAQGVFVQSGTRANEKVGHIIPSTLWQYMQRSTVSPDGWEKSFGVPLTAALPFTVTQNGHVHHMLVQVFLYAGLIQDQDASDLTNDSSIHYLNVGLDYLYTTGLPQVLVDAQQTVWSQGDSILLDSVNNGQKQAHIEQNFPLLLLGDTAWSANTLWYHVQWQVLGKTYAGWINSSSVTLNSPGDTTAHASFDALSSDLAAYLNSNGNTVGVTLYDINHQTYYTYNDAQTFTMASSVKVPILLTFLDMLEQQGREPDDNEQYLLTTMIENSDNDSATSLYDAVGGADGVSNYLQKIGIGGVSMDIDAWGYSQITPHAMVDLLTLLHNNKILNATHRALALNLMENIEADQLVGVGDNVPAGATVAMKDGWVTGPDGQWVMNSSGIITFNNQTYILAVYTQQQQSLEDGQTIARTVCHSIASLLNS